MTEIADRGIWGPGGYELLEIEEFQTRFDYGSYIFVTVRHTVTGEVYTHQLYCTETMYVQPVG